jgi:hypothetical protein
VASRGRSPFGRKTLVTLTLAAGRIPAAGPLPVRVRNANRFQVTGTLSDHATNKESTPRTRRVRLRAKSFTVPAHGHKTVKLSLPKPLRRALRLKQRLYLRLTAKLKDPAGHTRTVNKAVKPKLEQKHNPTRLARRRADGTGITPGYREGTQ